MNQHALGPTLVITFVFVWHRFMFSCAGFWFSAIYVGDSRSVAKPSWRHIFGAFSLNHGR